MEGHVGSVRTLKIQCIICVQYIGGCSVHQEVFSTSGDTISTSGGYLEYIGGCLVHLGDIMIHVGEQVNKSLTCRVYDSANIGAGQPGLYGISRAVWGFTDRL